jgi:hypothetical protein
VADGRQGQMAGGDRGHDSAARLRLYTSRGVISYRTVQLLAERVRFDTELQHQQKARILTARTAGQGELLPFDCCNGALIIWIWGADHLDFGMSRLVITLVG